MNQKRRNAIRKATLDFEAKLEALLSEYRETLESVLDEEQEAYDNMPESIQDSERGEESYNAIDALESTIGELDVDNVRDNLYIGDLFENCNIGY